MKIFGMSSTALFIFHEGLEELEAIAPLDILRRAGVECTTASTGAQLEVTGKNGITVKADELFEDIAENSYNLVVIPGGPGVYPLRENSRVIEFVRNHAEIGKPTAAICAAPLILNDAGVLEGRAYTAHSSVADELPDIHEGSAVVSDGHIITSRGAGSAIEFGLELAKRMTSSETSQAVAESINYQRTG
ncbi:MAG: DJ-1/PfpI family protein [Opitutales bacterium]|nr:DJ-1/PfpI family protein [Opitutales bacterium]